MVVPPLIDLGEIDGAPAVVDPFACADGTLAISDALRQGPHAASGVTTAQDGMGEGGQRSEEEELLAPSRESLRVPGED